MAKARIISGVRIDAFTHEGALITKDWTTVADDAVDGLLLCQYQGSSVIELDVPQAEVDEATAPFFVTDDDEDHYTEDESDGTE